MNPKVQKALTEIFKAVADACDGGEDVPEDILLAYRDALRIKEVKKFYGDLIKERSKELGFR